MTTREQLLAEIDSLLPTNGVGAIDASELRTVLEDIVLTAGPPAEAEDILNTALATLGAGSNVAIASTDTIILAFAKLQNQITAVWTAINAGLATQAQAAVASALSQTVVDIAATAYAFDKANSGKLHYVNSAIEWTATLPADAPRGCYFNIVNTGGAKFTVSAAAGATVNSQDQAGLLSITGDWSDAQAVCLSNSGGANAIWLLTGALE